MSFPDSFVWGAAAASYQIEGGHDADGKGPSVWDMLAHWPGKVYQGHTGDVACDHYHRFADDVAMMKQIGLQAYRLSISWPRVLPEGTGKPNEAGLAFYDRLIDALLEAGVTPWVTLFHWDYPLALFRRGGWLNPESPQWFAEYARLIVARLSDRVTHWFTLNEPQVFLSMGHQTGEHAPGLKLPLPEVLRAAHHSLIAHGRAVQVIREHAKAQPQVGWAPVGTVYYPVSDKPEDIEAARYATSAVWPGNLWSNAWYGDPVVLGHYPEQGLEAFGEHVPKFDPKDMDVIHQPLDFYGANIYVGRPVRAGDEGEPVQADKAPGYPHTLFNWPVTPQALRWGPRFLQERYGLPIYITENGMSNPDWVDLDGRVRDPQRIDLTRRYLQQLQTAIDTDSVDVRGYFHWSIMDNFEWAEGYKQRFGLIHIDYETLKRTPKDSAAWYSQVIKTNGAAIHEPDTATIEG